MFRRLLRTRLPALDDILAKNPCTRDLFLFFGWYVLLGITLVNNSSIFAIFGQLAKSVVCSCPPTHMACPHILRSYLVLWITIASFDYKFVCVVILAVENFLQTRYYIYILIEKGFCGHRFVMEDCIG